MIKFTFLEFQNYLNENLNLYNKAHQDAAFKLATSLLHKIKEPKLNYQLLFQTRINETDDSSNRVDIILNEPNSPKIVVMIDVTTDKNKKMAFERLRNIQLHNDNARSSEIFVFCYDSVFDSWYESSDSKILGELNK
jgi:hypothetical protein